jgi:hypothetical protein
LFFWSEADRKIRYDPCRPGSFQSFNFLVVQTVSLETLQVHRDRVPADGRSDRHDIFLFFFQFLCSFHSAKGSSAGSISTLWLPLIQKDCLCRQFLDLHPLTVFQSACQLRKNFWQRMPSKNPWHPHSERFQRFPGSQYADHALARS